MFFRLVVTLCVVVLTAPPARAECDCWRYVRTGAGGAGTTLAEVTAPGLDVAWAAGSRGDRPMLLRWDGRRWRESRAPFPAGTLLEGVAATSERDSWVVGYDDGRPEVARWDGRGWTNIAMPKNGPAFPRAIDARSAGDAWIVGSSSGFAGTLAASWRWDGRSWRAVPVRDGSELAAVSALGAADAWAVGSQGVASARQLLLHWDGEAWKPAPAPALPGESVLHDVVMLAPDDVWAVGAASAVRDRPLAEHWDGQTWRAVPGPPSVSGRFFSVAGDGARGVWAAGQRSDGTALLAHWDGRGWDVSQAPTPSRRGPAALWAVTQVPGTPYVWAAGHTESPGYQALTWTNAPRPR